MNSKTVHTKATFTQGSVFQALIRFAGPVLLALILQAAYGAVDLLIVGRFHPVAVGAVGTGSNIMHMITVVITGLSTGATVMIGQHIGEKDKEAAGRAAGTAVVLFAAVALFLTVVTECFALPFAKLLNVSEQDGALDECVSYLRICAAGIPVIIAYNVISGILRGAGNSRLPLLFVAIACAVNIAGDLLLVKTLDMGAAGAAIATVAAQGVSVLCSVFVLKRGNIPISFGKKYIRVDRTEMKKILSVGAPIALQEFMVQISFMVINGVTNSIGTGHTAADAYAIAQKMISFIMLVPSSVAQSTSAFTAQNIGAGQRERAKDGVVCAILTGAALGIGIFFAAYLYGGELCRLFLTGDTADSENVIMLATQFLKGFAPDCILTCALFSSIGYFNGCGKSIPVMAQGISAAFLVRIPVCLLMSGIAENTMYYIGCATPITTVYGIIFFIICFLKSD